MTTSNNINHSVKHWYIPLLIGFLFIATGIYTFFSPLKSYLVLATFFSISFLISGILETIFAITNRKQIHNWGWTLVLGVLTTLIGVMLLNNPQVSMVTLPLYVGFVIMFRSFMAIGTAIDLKNYGVLDWGNLMLIGVLGIIFSFFLIFNPLFGGMTIIFWTGFSFLIIGIFSVYIAIRLKKLKRTVDIE